MRAAFAYVNHGSWVADCPFGCRGVERAREDVFMCRECANAPNGHRPVVLVWPADEDVRAIEAALVVRPVIENRNWNLSESIGALLAENAMHGLLDPGTGQVYGDIGADQKVVPLLRSLARLELTA